MSSKKTAPVKGQTAELPASLGVLVKYKKQIIAATAAIVLVVGGIAAYHYFVSVPNENKAQEMLGQGLNYEAQADQLAGQIAQMDMQMAADTTGMSKDSTVMKQYEEAKKQVTDQYNKAIKGDGKYIGFEKIARNYSSTDAGNLAKARAGICYHKLGNYKEAIKWLEDFSPAGDKTVSPQIVNALGHSYAANNQVDKAIETFKKAAKLADNDAQSPLFLFAAANLLKDQKKNKEALELYEQIKSNYPTAALCSPQQAPDGTITQPQIDAYIELVK